MAAFRPSHEAADIPARLLDLFTLEAGCLRWASACPASWRGAVRAPWGKLAGGKPVFGRGRLINAKRANLLTADVIYALEHGGDWAWQIDASLVPAEPLGTDAMHSDHWRALIRSRFAVRDGALVWAVDRGFNPDRTVRYPAGSRASGLAMSGFRAPIVSTGGMAFLSTDLVSVIETGLFPWEAWN